MSQHSAYEIRREIRAQVRHTGYALLSSADEQALAVRIKAGDRAAVNELAEKNLRWAMTFSSRYLGDCAGRGAMTFDDTYQNACLGLLHAAARYDGRGKFSTYATWWMRQSINRGAEEQRDLIRIPAYVQTATRKLRRGNSDNVARDSAIAATAPAQPLSYDIPVYTDADVVSLRDIIADDARDLADDVSERIDSGELLDWIRGHLSATEWAVFTQRWDDDAQVTLAKIATRVGLTRERVRQIEARASLKLRVLGLCPDGAVRPHGPLARQARAEWAEKRRKERASSRQTHQRQRAAERAERAERAVA